MGQVLLSAHTKEVFGQAGHNGIYSVLVGCLYLYRPMVNYNIAGIDVVVIADTIVLSACTKFNDE